MHNSINRFIENLLCTILFLSIKNKQKCRKHKFCDVVWSATHKLEHSKAALQMIFYWLFQIRFWEKKKTSARNLTALIFYERLQMACVIYNCVANITKFLQAVQSLHFIIKNDYRRMKSLCIWSINKLSPGLARLFLINSQKFEYFALKADYHFTNSPHYWKNGGVWKAVRRYL